MANTKIPSELIADSSITAAKLADGTITTADIADSNVTTAKIADSNVTTAKIGDAQVTTAKITDANVTTGKIADDAVTTAKMASNSVTSDTIASGITLAGTTNTAALNVTGNITTAEDVNAIYTFGRYSSGVAYSLLRASANATGLEIRTNAGNAMGRFLNNGTVQLFNNGTSVLTTDSAGINIPGTLDAGTINVTGTVDGIDIAARDSVLTSTTTTAGAALPKAGGTMTGNITLQDDTKVIFGTGADLHIYHTGGHNYIDVSSGDQDLIIKGTDGSTDFTALTLDMSDAGTAIFNNKVVVDTLELAPEGSNDRIKSTGGVLYIKANELSIQDNSGNQKLAIDTNILLDTAGVIVLDADNAGVIQLKDGGLHYGSFYTASDALNIQSNINNADMNFIGKDDNTNITALTFDMSEAGAATFNAGATFGNSVNISHGTPVLTLTDTSSSATTTITLDGVHTTIDSNGTDGDIIFKGSDGGSEITALTLDMSDLGTAYFNSSIVIPDNLMHTGDLNTYIGFPEDDAFRVVTGGGEAIRVTSAQLVGINTTAPDTYLEVDIKNDSDGNGIHITSTSTTNDPSLKISRNGGAADVFSMRPRGGAGSAYFAIAPGTNLDGGINLKASGDVGLGGNSAPISTLHMYGNNTADVASNGAGINGLHLSRTSSKGENIYAYMTDGNAASSSWAGLGNVAKIESYGNNAFEIGTQQNSTLVIGQNNTQKIRIKGDITAHAKFGATYIESLYTPNGGVQNCRIFEDHLGKWVAVGYFAADAKLSIQTTWGSARGAPTGLGQSETTVFSADWGDSYPTEVRYLGATDFNNFQETKTIDFIHGVPVGRPWKQFFNNAHRIPDGGTSVSSSLMGTVQGPVGSVKNGWECRGAYDGRGRWHNPTYTHHRMSDQTSINCADTAFTTPTSSHFNWEAASDAKISVHHSLDYSGQDGITSAAFGNDDNIVAFFDDYPTDRTNFGSTSNNYTSAVYVLMKLPEMQSIGLQGGRSRDHQPGEVVQTKVYERNSDVSATSGLTGEFGSLAFTPLYGNSLLEFNIHANTGSNDGNTVVWKIYQGSPSAVGTLIRRTGNQIINNDTNTDGQELPFSWTQYYQLNDDKKSAYTYRVQFSPSGATYWGHTYGVSAHSYFTIKEIKQEHNAKLITD